MTHFKMILRAMALVIALLLVAGCLGEVSAPSLADALMSLDESEATPTPAPTPEPTSEPSAEPVPAHTAQPSAAPQPLPSPEAVEVTDSALKDDGMLRVLLRSLESPRQLNLTVAGAYALDGDVRIRFERGAQIALVPVDGEVCLLAGGLAVSLGQSATFLRHAAAQGAENGLYIAQAPRNTLYCGDLTVSISDDGSLRSVLTIPVEDYLYGVVAYEMSDSFPIEALKAQAVAARTYALQRKSRASDRDYDVVDTTADQVFRGFDPQYTHIIEAVDATRGIVGTFNGGFAVCYYTASNGGQTALASQIWGGTDSDGYLAMKDDPYDIENPRSMVKSVTVTADGEGSEALRQLLEAHLAVAMEAAGYAREDWALAGIASIECADPAFEGSRMFRRLDFGLRVKVKHETEAEASGEVAPSTAAPSEAEAPETGAQQDLDAAAEALAQAADGDPNAGWDEEPPAGFVLPGFGEIQQRLNEMAAGQASEITTGDTSWTSEYHAPVAGIEPGWVLLDAVYPVSLDVYDEIKDGLSLGLNSADYELVSVETTLDNEGGIEAFTIAMRRFGHGVGMSQRGAQRMAGHYGMTWQQIVGFYYPGMNVERIEWPEMTLPELAAMPSGMDPKATPAPTPTPAPLPALEEGEHYAVVTLESAGSSLNVRKAPSTSAEVVDRLAHGRRVIVCSEPDADGWVSVRTAEIEGYAKAEYLKQE